MLMLSFHNDILFFFACHLGQNLGQVCQKNMKSIWYDFYIYIILLGNACKHYDQPSQQKRCLMRCKYTLPRERLESSLSVTLPVLYNVMQLACYMYYIPCVLLIVIILDSKFSVLCCWLAHHLNFIIGAD